MNNLNSTKKRSNRFSKRDNEMAQNLRITPRRANYLKRTLSELRLSLDQKPNELLLELNKFLLTGESSINSKWLLQENLKTLKNVLHDEASRIIFLQTLNLLETCILPEFHYSNQRFIVKNLNQTLERIDLTISHINKAILLNFKTLEPFDEKEQNHFLYGK